MNSNSSGIALWIVFNIIFLLSVIIRSIVWKVFEKDRFTYIEFVFWDNVDPFSGANLSSIFGIVVNGFGVIALLVVYFSKIV